MTVDLIELDARAMAAYGNTFRARVRRELKRAPEGRTCELGILHSRVSAVKITPAGVTVCGPCALDLMEP